MSRRRALFAIVAAAFTLGPLGLAAGTSTAPIQALWVWTPPFGTFAIWDEQAQDALVRDSALMAVRSLYVSVYQGSANSNNRLMHEEQGITELITKAHAAGIEVWASSGNFDWAEIGCNGFPMERMDEIIAYNNDANAPAKFDGVVLDIEPKPLDFLKLLTLYECIRERLDPNDIPLAVAIQFYWDELVEFPTGGVKQEAYKHIIDLGLSNVIVMGYREAATLISGLIDDGMISRDEDEVQYADSVGRNDLILVGVETSDCVARGDCCDYEKCELKELCCDETVTFFEEGHATLDRELERVAIAFAAYDSFGGFAVHAYADAYLGRLRWPGPCGDSQAPVCGGVCPPPQECKKARLHGISTEDYCRCVDICGPTAGPLDQECGGYCDPGSHCEHSPAVGCRCVSDACHGSFGQCGGTCPPGETCQSDEGVGCSCAVPSCHGSPGQCWGTCPVWQECIDDHGVCRCEGSLTPEPRFPWLDDYLERFDPGWWWGLMLLPVLPMAWFGYRAWRSGRSARSVFLWVLAGLGAALLVGVVMSLAGSVFMG